MWKGRREDGRRGKNGDTGSRGQHEGEMEGGGGGQKRNKIFYSPN